MAEWEKLREKIVHLQGDITPFGVEFLDRDAFKKFCDNLYHDIGGFKEICITGYFSETIRDELQKILQLKHRTRLICPEFAIVSNRDKRNLEALKKLSDAGAEVKFNNRIHARLLIAYEPKAPELYGTLVLGSFDFNTECIGKERFDAGIKTKHPDLLRSAIGFFEEVWNDSESLTIEEFLKSKKSPSLSWNAVK